MKALLKKWLPALWFGLGFFSLIHPAQAELPKHPLIALAQQKEPEKVKYALAQGAQAGLTADGKSYYVLWFPKGYGPQNLPPMVTTLHGHAGCAFVDFFVWQKFLKERGYGLLAIQWWKGGGESIRDYLTPHEIYRIIDQTFRGLGVKPGTALLHGFSRGSANIYAVAALDRTAGPNYFSLFIANSGKADITYPPTQEIDLGRFGEKPFAGSRWITYAGSRDPNPDRDGIPAMRATGQWIKKLGGVVDLAIEDPEGDHGGFHRRPENCDKALDVFETLRIRPEQIS